MSANFVGSPGESLVENVSGTATLAQAAHSSLHRSVNVAVNRIQTYLLGPGGSIPTDSLQTVLGSKLTKTAGAVEAVKSDVTFEKDTKFGDRVTILAGTAPGLVVSGNGSTKTVTLDAQSGHTLSAQSSSSVGASIHSSYLEMAPTRVLLGQTSGTVPVPSALSLSRTEGALLSSSVKTVVSGPASTKLQMTSLANSPFVVLSASDTRKIQIDLSGVKVGGPTSFDSKATFSDGVTVSGMSQLASTAITTLAVGPVASGLMTVGGLLTANDYVVLNKVRTGGSKGFLKLTGENNIGLADKVTRSELDPSLVSELDAAKRRNTDLESRLAALESLVESLL